MIENEKMCLKYALEILLARANDANRSIDSRHAYTTAADILEYAIKGQYDCLVQFDYN